MPTNHLAIVSAIAVASTACGTAAVGSPQGQYVQVAELEIDAVHLEAYKAAVVEQIETAVRVEPGVLTLYAVSDRDSPNRVRVFEIYRDLDAYKAHLQSAHFKKYKTATERMVKSLRLVRAEPIRLGTKACNR